MADLRTSSGVVMVLYALLRCLPYYCKQYFAEDYLR
jgi:hypothetical protein